MAAALTRGALDSIISTGQCPDNIVVQVFDIKVLNTNRYRVMLYDGVQKATAMPTSHLNNDIASGKIVDNTIVRIRKVQASEIQTTKVIILFDWEPIGMGEPLAKQGQQAAPAASAPAPTPAAAPVPTANPYANYPTPSAQAPSYGAPAQHPSYGASSSMPPAAPSYGGSGPYGASAVSHPYGQPPQQHQYPSAPATSVYGNNPYGGGSAPSAAHRGGAIVKDGVAPVNVVPIASINPYSGSWTIKARITAKSEIRRWSNARGEGTLFSIDLLDAHGGEIRGTFFKAACDKWYPALEEGKVYTFSKGVIKAVQNRQFSNIKNSYELTFNENSEIHAVMDDIGIKTQHYSFTKIDSIALTEPNSTIDVIALVKNASDMTEITSTKMGNKQLKKRDLTLIDETGNEIKLTLWGDRAQANYDWMSRPIVAFKGVKVGDYGGRSLSSTQSTGIALNPPIPEGVKLNDYAQSFPNREIPVGASLSGQVGGAGGMSGADLIEKRKTASSIKDEGLGMQEKPDYITVKATTTYIKHDNDCWYPACPSEGCNKKVIETHDGSATPWRCEKCNKSFPNCQYRYVMSAIVADHTGGTWVSLFNETAEAMLGISAGELNSLKRENREMEVEKIFSDALFKTHILRLRVKSELVSDEQRVKASVMKLDPIDYANESKMLLDAIERYN